MLDSRKKLHSRISEFVDKYFSGDKSLSQFKANVDNLTFNMRRCLGCAGVYIVAYNDIEYSANNLTHMDLERINKFLKNKDKIEKQVMDLIKPELTSNLN